MAAAGQIQQIAFDSNNAGQPFTLRRSYVCRCGRPIFFRNSLCLNCLSALGYEPDLGELVPIAPEPEHQLWRLNSNEVSHVNGKQYRRCANLNTAASCNWLVEVGSGRGTEEHYCVACRLNRTVPDLSFPENAELWGRIEVAKRYVVSSLIALGLPVASRVHDDPKRGLAFDFLRALQLQSRIITGHDNGLITINIEEADDVKREQMRTSMHEPYRTLVGHFRHEVGHYYWNRLVAHSHWTGQFRSLFGDERANYDEALQRNYREGPKSDWISHYISAYASVHPWEDWAETWAHYLHMVDALGTAVSFGLQPETMSMPFDCYGPDVLWTEESGDTEEFLPFVNSWLKLTAVMNELCRSMGQPDFYPFSLSRLAVTKIHFVHLVVRGAGRRLQTDGWRQALVAAR